MASSNRDDFSTRVQTELSLRAGLCCSAPGCAVLTKGPADAPAGVVNIGVAAHIKAASPQGPRFDAAQSPAERTSGANGIWLCANCARRVDSDPGSYSVELLLDWKHRHEEDIRIAVGRPVGAPAKLPELPVQDRYLEEKGIRRRLSHEGFEIHAVYRHEAVTKVGLGEAKYVVDPDTEEGPARLVVGNPYREDLVYVAVPKRQ